MAEYTYYKNQYYGGTVPAESWNYFAARAQEQIDAFLAGRRVDDTDALDKCQCRIAEILYNASKKEGVTSESVNGYYTVSYSVLSNDEVKRQIANAFKTYLWRYAIVGARCIIY